MTDPIYWPRSKTPKSRGNAFDLTAPGLVDWSDVRARAKAAAMNAARSGKMPVRFGGFKGLAKGDAEIARQMATAKARRGGGKAFVAIKAKAKKDGGGWAVEEF